MWGCGNLETEMAEELSRRISSGQLCNSTCGNVEEGLFPVAG